LAESLLGFVVGVALTFVEGVSAFANHVRADRHADAFLLAGPGFGGIEKFCACTEATLAVSDDQAVYFGAEGDFEKRRDADVNPTDDVLFEFSHKNSVGAYWFDVGETPLHFFCGSWIAKLAAEFGESRNVCGFSVPDFYSSIFCTHRFKPFYAAAWIVPRRFAARAGHQLQSSAPNVSSAAECAARFELRRDSDSDCVFQCCAGPS